MSSPTETGRFRHEIVTWIQAVAVVLVVGVVVLLVLGMPLPEIFRMVVNAVHRLF